MSSAQDEVDNLFRDVVAGNHWPKTCLNERVPGNECSFEEFRWHCYEQKLRNPGISEAEFNSICQSDWEKLVKSGVGAFEGVESFYLLFGFWGFWVDGTS